MISFQTARRRILRHCRTLGTEKLSLPECLGRVLAKTLRAPVPLPVQDNSAMDGFALDDRDTRTASRQNPSRLKIGKTVRAGSRPRFRLKKGECARIMTGACLPDGANAVAAKEDVLSEKNVIVVRAPVRKGNHVRFKGEEIQKGKVALQKGQLVHPGTVAALAALGIKTVPVFRTPKISLIVTGSELASPGKRLRPGQIYDANSALVQAALRQMNVPLLHAQVVPDRPQELARALSGALSRSEVVLVAGGISVGDFDFVRQTVRSLGVKTLFWKVDQKPGKPLFFGKKEKTLVFGLPGNPVSVWICFYEYVYPALRMLSGHRFPELPRKTVLCREQLTAGKRKTVFFRGNLKPESQAIDLLRHQGSHCVLSLSKSNAILPVNASFRKGGRRTVRADTLPFSG